MPDPALRRVLVTGGLGYIGSHVCVALQKQGYELLVVDNLSNSTLSALAEIRALGGGAVEFRQADLCDARALEAALGDRSFDVVIHLAAAKSLPRSLREPQFFHDNNVTGSVNLLREMERRGLRKLVFSSSAAVYGAPLRLPVVEEHPLQPQNPYARTKVDVEQRLREAADADPAFHFVILRLFNAAGAAAPGGTDLMVMLARVAAGELPELEVFGGDYETPDGSCVRDYVHVLDLASGHSAALHYLSEHARSITVNFGSGRGVSVKELIATFERVNGVRVPHRVVGRRAGDVPASYADVSFARRALGWVPSRNLEQICIDSWRRKQRVN